MKRAIQNWFSPEMPLDTFCTFRKLPQWNLGLRRSLWRARHARPESDCHGRVFRIDDIKSARQEMVIHGNAGPIDAKGGRESSRMDKRPSDKSDHAKTGRAVQRAFTSFSNRCLSATAGIGVRRKGRSRERYGDASGEVPGLWGRRLRATFGI